MDTTSTDSAWLLGLLQTSDALFPTGSYAHSLGFEEAVRLGIVRDAATLAPFLVDHVAGALQQQELPYLRFAFDAAKAGDFAILCELDAEVGAWKLAAETRTASVQIGTRRLQALATISDHPLIAKYAAAIREGRAIGHHVIVCGVQAAVEGIPLQAALAAWFYQAMAGICSAALKLIRIGQEGVQRALRTACVAAPSAIEASLSVEREQAGWFGPILEIASMRHLRAEERLFIS